MQRQSSTRNASRSTLWIPCILLLAVLSVAEASHVHPASSKFPGHSCSLCSAIHSGIRIERTYIPSPVTYSAETIGIVDETLRPIATVPSLFIRPPPLV